MCWPDEASLHMTTGEAVSKVDMSCYIGLARFAQMMMVGQIKVI